MSRWFAGIDGSSDETFSEYIKANETDFIQFKTKLLLENTENDPVTRAKLITDVVRSVSVIPDNITRSVYIKECSRLLNVDEEVLYAEVRKLKRKKSDDLKKAEIREKPQKVTPQPVLEPRQTEELIIEEREMIRFLLKYFHAPLFEVENESGESEIITAGAYIIGEIEEDGLVSENSALHSFIDEVKEQASPEFDPVRYFIQHPDEKLSRLASDLLSDKHVESKRCRRPGYYAEKEEDILDILIPKIVNEYKLTKVRHLIENLYREIDDSAKTNDFEKIFEFHSTIMNLKKVEKLLSDQLGNRTFI